MGIMTSLGADVIDESGTAVELTDKYASGKKVSNRELNNLGGRIIKSGSDYSIHRISGVLGGKVGSKLAKNVSGKISKSFVKPFASKAAGQKIGQNLSENIKKNWIRVNDDNLIKFMPQTKENKEEIHEQRKVYRE